MRRGAAAPPVLFQEKATKTFLPGFASPRPQWHTNEGRRLCCVRPPPMWNQLPVELRTIESFSCLKRSLKQCLVMTRSCRDCSNWCYLRAPWVSCVFMGLCLSQVILRLQLSAPFTLGANKSIMAWMYISQPCLFMSDGPAICSLYTFYAHMFISRR